MNMLVINGSADLYGANRILYEVLEIIAQYHKVVLVLPVKGELIDYIKEKKSNITIEIIEELPIISRGIYRPKGIIDTIRKYRKAKGALNKLVAKHQITDSYINTLSCLFCIKLCRDLGLKPVVHVHEIIEHPAIAAFFINKLGLRWAKRIIAVSNAVSANLLRFGRNKGEKITTIPNGIPDLPADITTDRSPNTKVKITLIGRIKPEKGIWFFLDAITQLGEQGNQCEFLIVGGTAPNGDHYVTALTKDIANHRSKGCISYHPFMEDVSLLQLESDILVVPSLMKDPFPTTILEAMRAGKPVIATDHGGGKESIKNNETGILVKPGDVDGFANALSKLVKNRNLRNQMGNAGRMRYLANFTISEFEKRISTFFALDFEKIK